MMACSVPMRGLAKGKWSHPPSSDWGLHVGRELAAGSRRGLSAAGLDAIKERGSNLLLI